jgi:AP2-associated kinase
MVFKLFEGFEKNTTLMYRPPEMLDQYSKFDIDFKADIWMIGCILYTLCYAKHPFMDA